ncbi:MULTISPECIES: hypothetical protein [Klebsiella]|jgi:hypothetical protein|uniref:hypothetical protein n=1 Tax=Klebsiella TaxID=570 RepID=UPI001BA6C305|nr:MULTISPECIES: hypothetical protein [Klebsiella]HCI6133367.1 hypothetical protein [Klebsiella variicola subsp. variicola]MCQ3990745.1 hypothetical protein [Klebsiella pneumoniae]MDR4525746.1 hypothetical protein [Klebsiella pneumoniae]MDR4530767.1 hypothetical protein [Klebsiella pneumoniae]MDR4553968.1 hypothetical protein [Klebsiella pneumoniae]
MKQVRIYTLKDTQSAEIYFHRHWPRHMVSLPAFNIYVNHVYLGNECQVIATVTYQKEADIQAINQKYMNSDAFMSDMEGFDMSSILRVDEISIKEALF